MSLEPVECDAVVRSLLLREGWEIEYTHNPGADDREHRIDIKAWVLNTRYDANPKSERKHVRLHMPRYAPAGATELRETFLAWVLYEYLWLTMHEELEWFRDKTTKLPVVDPHDSDLTVNGLLPPRPGTEWWIGVAREAASRTQNQGITSVTPTRSRTRT